MAEPESKGADVPGAARDGARLDRRVSECVATLRLPLMLGPVLVHACLEPRRSLAQYVLARVVGDIAVPVLFFISGLLFLATYDGTAGGWLRKIGRRLRTLGIPYLFWNLVCFLVFSYGINIVARGDFLKAFWGVRVARRAVSTAPVNGPLYFVKDIFFLSLAAPALFFALKRKALAWLAPAAALAWLLMPLAGLADHAIVTGGVFFALGGFAATRGAGHLAGFVASRRAATGAILVFAAVSAAHVALHAAGAGRVAQALLQRANILCALPFCFACASLVRARTAAFLGACGGAAMFLFCTFDIVLVALRYSCVYFFGRSTAVCLLAAAITLAVSLASYALLSLCAPGLLALLVGGRHATPARSKE